MYYFPCKDWPYKNKSIFPCKNCSKRRFGCHDSCDKYQEAKMKHKQEQERKRLDDYMFSRYLNTLR